MTDVEQVVFQPLDLVALRPLPHRLGPAGQPRLDAYAALDKALMKDAAPVAPYISTNARVLTSTKVGCYGYTSIQGSLLTQICTK